MNEQLLRQKSGAKLVDEDPSPGHVVYQEEISNLFEKGCATSEEGLEKAHHQHFNSKASLIKLRQMVQLERNPHLVAYFAENLPLLSKMQAQSKNIQKEWASLIRGMNLT